jgi:hypothetical protein
MFIPGILKEVACTFLARVIPSFIAGIVGRIIVNSYNREDQAR